MKPFKVPKRIEELKAEVVFNVLSRALAAEASGKKIIHLEIGEPDFDTPQHIKEAAYEALRQGKTHYTPTLGIPELRKAIAESVQRDYGVEISWEKNVAVTTGCKQAIFAATLAVVEEGDEVIYPNPGYPVYESAAFLAGGKPIPYRVTLEDNYRIIPEKLAELVTPKTKLVFINSPNNPCGTVMSEEDVRGIVELSEDYGFFIISDEVYRPILFDGLKHFSPLNVKGELDRIIIVDGFSKRYAMTGWRLGYLLAPEEVLPYIFKILNVSTSCPVAFNQYAGIAALRGPQEPSIRMVKEYERRRNIILEELSKIEGIRFTRPTGAFYAFIDVSRVLDKLGIGSEEFVLRLIDNYGVSLLHGSALGSYGEGFIRISFANSEENLREGVRRLKKAIDDALKS